MHVPCAIAAGTASAAGSALAGRPSYAGPHTGMAAGSKRLRHGIQCSRMRLSARRPAQNLLAAVGNYVSRRRRSAVWFVHGMRGHIARHRGLVPNASGRSAFPLR
jgi:hypothetical protein